MRRTSTARWVLCTSVCIASWALADADSAKKYLQEAHTATENNDPKAAETSLQLAEAELDSVDAAAKAPIAEDIAALKRKIMDAAGAGRAEEIKKDLDSRMELARRNLDTTGFNENEKDILDFLAQDEVKAALGADTVAKYKRQLATFHKVAAGKAAVANMERLKSDLEYSEGQWAEKLKDFPDASPDARRTDIEEVQRSLEEPARITKELPEGNADAQVLVARFNKLNNVVNAEAMKARSGDVYDQLKRNWELYADEREGWDKENTGPTFEQLTHQQSDEMSRLLAPKTVALIQRTNAYFDMDFDDETTRQLAVSDPKIKAYLDGIRAQQKTALDKLAKFAAAVLDEAEKANIDKDARDRLESFANDDLRIALEGSDQLKPLQQRAMKLVSAFDQKAVGDAAARDKLYNTLIEQANKAWPAMSKDFEATDGLDAVGASQKIESFKGKTVRLKAVQNRMGYDYSPSSGYDFAMTIDSVPVAGKYEPAIRKAYNGITAKTGKDFSAEDCDIIATVEGMGPIVRIARTKGSVQTTGGENVGTITSEGNETVTGIRLKIIGLHVAPMAATSSGAVDENGNIAP